jgi:hypothetical protein
MINQMSNDLANHDSSAGTPRIGLHALVRLRLTPISLDEANAYVSENHRHHNPVTGHKFSVAISDENGRVRGVAIVGRPVSRLLDNGWTLEVNRCCTDGVPNGCSMLYRAAWRAASAMGYARLITYTLPEEGGGSLKGAGFRLVGERGGGTWNRRERPRVDTHPTQTKWLWELHDGEQPNDAKLSHAGRKPGIASTKNDENQNS